MISERACLGRGPKSGKITRINLTNWSRFSTSPRKTMRLNSNPRMSSTFSIGSSFLRIATGKLTLTSLCCSRLFTTPSVRHITQHSASRRSSTAMTPSLCCYWTTASRSFSHLTFASASARNTRMRRLTQLCQISSLSPNIMRKGPSYSTCWQIFHLSYFSPEERPGTNRGCTGCLNFLECPDSSNCSM